MGTAAERYQIRRAIQDGGMSKLVLAYDKQLSRDIALKLVLKSSLRPVDLKMVSQEARILAQFRHPNIVSVHDSGFDTFKIPVYYEGTPDPVWETHDCFFVVQDLIKGKDLVDFIDLLKRETGARDRWPRRRILKDCLLPALNGLAEAHERRVVHRDIKPANMMIDGRNRVYLIDFGLAQVGAKEGQLVCTPMYASPEQLRAESLDARTDIYSFGATMYQTMTYSPPFEADDESGLLGLTQKVLHEEPPPPNEKLKSTQVGASAEEIPEDLSNIMIRCLAKKAGDRYQSAGQLKADLFRYLVNEAPVGERWLWPKDSVLIREGEHGKELFYIQSGQVTVEQGGKQVAVLGPGQWMGFAAIAGAPRTATVRSLEDCETLVFSDLNDEKLYGTVEKDPALAVSLIKAQADLIQKLQTPSAPVE